MTVCTVSGNKYRECVVINGVVWLYKQAPVHNECLLYRRTQQL